MLLMKNWTMSCVLVYLLMFSIIYGCGSEDDDIEPIELIRVRPEIGTTFFFQYGAGITLEFDSKPDMVMVNNVIMPEARPFFIYEKDKIIGIESYSVSFDIYPFISEPGQVTLTVTWIDRANRESSTTLYYNIIKRCCLPEFLGSDPGDKAIDVDPIRLNKEGIKILFSEPLIIEKIELHFIVDDNELQWKISTDLMDKRALLLRPLPGNELGVGQKVVVRLENVMDQAGNLYASDRTLPFGIPDGILELHFTTAEKDR